MYRIVIYGYAIPFDRFQGKGSGTLVDMTYYSTEPISVSEILQAIEGADYQMIVKRGIDNRVIQDRVTIDEINIGIDEVYY